jgi:hypothetical protein
MQRQNYIFGLLLLVFFSVGSIIPGKLYAQEAVFLPITPLAQRFAPADPNGDAGVADCMPAALTMALNTLAEENMLSRNSADFSYAAIRRYLRMGMPDPKRGIAPELLVDAARQITDEKFSLQLKKIDPSSWRYFLQGELKKGYPVIVHVADRSTLTNPLSRTTHSHVIVVYGMDDETIYYADSWDGMAHGVSDEAFSQAWGKGHYQWLVFQFEKKEYTTFREILLSLKT